MRIHLLALPNAQTTREYSLCGFTQATIRFARILKDLGHHVTLYASEENEAPCDELVTCIQKEEIQTLLSMGSGWAWEYQSARIESDSPLFQIFNSRCATQIEKLKQPRDIICQITGYPQQYVSNKHPDLMTVEYSIGYKGSFSNYRVFESATWQHMTYGAQNIDVGRFFDAVIPCFFDPEELPFCEKPDPYFVYVGRLVELKGIGVACEIASKAGVKLKIVGHGNKSLITGNHEYLGALDAKSRNEVLSKAMAIIAPTLYVEPFGCSPIEAQMCGTPVISTDFGGFVETVEQGKTGFRCSYLGDFVKAVKKVSELDRKYVRDRAYSLYSLTAATKQYRDYFNRLNLLWNGGWGSLH